MNRLAFTWAFAAVALACSGESKSESSSSGAAGPACVANVCGGCEPLSGPLPGTACGEGKFIACTGANAAACSEGAGPPVTQLTASQDVTALVRLAWSPPADRATAGYQVYRDGQLLAVTQRPSFEDTDAEAGKIEAPSGVTASDEAFPDKVAVSWKPGTTSAGRAHSYVVRPLYLQGAGPVPGPGSNVAMGNRAPELISGYDVSRDNGDWVSAGTKSTFDDLDAPRVAVTGLDKVRAEVRLPAGVALLRVGGGEKTSDFSIALPKPSLYRVRARVGDRVVESANTDLGAVKGTTKVLGVQWQRSSGDNETNFTDVPKMTGAVWYDEAGPTTGVARYYRAKISFEGTEVFSKAVRVAGVFAMKEAEIFQEHGCGLRTDGTLYCWGSDSAGRVALRPQGAFTRVAVGSEHNCALSTAGAIACWGSTANSRTTPPGTVGPNAKDIASSATASCALTSGGALVCWGSTELGQTTPPVGAFKRVFGGLGIGFCALREADGAAVCWGGRLAPPSAGPFVKLALNQNSTCGLLADGRIQCSGALAGPAANETFLDLSRGSNGYCALRSSDSTMECFGDDSLMVRGQTGVRFKSLVTGDQIACGLTDAGRFFCLPSRSSSALSRLPLDVDFSHVSASGKYSSLCATTSQNRRLCWGDDQNAATRQTRDGVKATYTFGGGGCSLLLTGEADCWGPLAGSLGGKYSELAWGYEPNNREGATACALRTDDQKVDCIEPINANNSKGNPSGSGPYTSIGTTFGAICGVQPSGRVECTGNTDSRIVGGQPPAATGKFKMVSATGNGRSQGGGGACALAEDGRAFCWGNAPALPQDGRYRFIAARQGASCALRADDGRRECVGDDTGTSLDAFRFITLSRGGIGCGVRTDGRLVCWTGTHGGAPSFE